MTIASAPKMLQLARLTVPRCGRTYGVAPCNARLASANDPVAVSFNGEDAFLTRGADLTGAANSKQLTISAWIRPGLGATLQRIFSAATGVGGGTVRLRLSQAADNSLLLIGQNAATTEILRIASSPLTVGRLCHVAISVDLSNASKRHIYVSDVSDLAAVTTYTDDTLDLTHADWAIGGVPDGSGLFMGELADLYVNFGVYLDLSVTANRRKFIDASGNPVSLGATGSVPTGSSPIVFMGGAFNTWGTNKGTGGGMTAHGALALGAFATGSRKCFETPPTCQDDDNYLDQPAQILFGENEDTAPRDLDAQPMLAGIEIDPGIASLGRSIGHRETARVMLRDRPHSDTGGYDPYPESRNYDPIAQGTYLGKLRARSRFIRGRDLEVIFGFAGQAIADMEIRRYHADALLGPARDGGYTIAAKDPIKAWDGNRALAPAPTEAFLASDHTASQNTVALLPAGAGSLFATSGVAAIGGREVIAWTGKSGDTLTGVSRGQMNTTAVAHKAQDRVQLPAAFVALRPSEIVERLAVDYAGTDSALIPIDDWNAECDANLGQVYTAYIFEPTAVATLINEIIVQAALSTWWDPIGGKIRLRVLRPIDTSAELFDEAIRDDDLRRRVFKRRSLEIVEQPELRVSRVLTYYAPVNPLKRVDDLDNYRSAHLSFHAKSEGPTRYGSKAAYVIKSRWIQEGGRSIVQAMNAKHLARYLDPPRRFVFTVPRRPLVESLPQLGEGYRISEWRLQDDQGAIEKVPFQITSLKPGKAEARIEGEEMLFSDEIEIPAPDGVRVVTLESNGFNKNIRAMFDALYGAPAVDQQVRVELLAGVKIGSVSPTLPALDLGDWPSGVDMVFAWYGLIEGGGGLGGAGGAWTGAANPAAHGGNGGVGLKVRRAVTIEGSGEARGGGGGGGGGSPGVNSGGGGGGGGAGINGGTGGAGGFAPIPGQAGSPGTETAGGAGGNGGTVGKKGGAGGAPGANGSPGLGSGLGPQLYGNGGAAGAAIDGIAFVTGGGSLTIVGPTI